MPCAMPTPIHLTHTRPNTTIHISHYSSVTNAAELHVALFPVRSARAIASSLTPGHTRPDTDARVDPARQSQDDHECESETYIDASKILSPTHLLAAIHRAVTLPAHRRKTRGLGSEILFSLGYTNNIASTLKHFGLSPLTTELIVVHVKIGTATHLSNSGDEAVGTGSGPNTTVPEQSPKVFTTDLTPSPHTSTLKPEATSLPTNVSPPSLPPVSDSMPDSHPSNPLIATLQRSRIQIQAAECVPFSTKSCTRSADLGQIRKFYRLGVDIGSTACATNPRINDKDRVTGLHQGKKDRRLNRVRGRVGADAVTEMASEPETRREEEIGTAKLVEKMPSTSDAKSSGPLGEVRLNAAELRELEMQILGLMALRGMA